MLDVLFFLLTFLSFIGLIIGLIKPDKVIKWGEKKTRKQVALTYGIAIFVFFILFVISIPPTEKKPLTEQQIETKPEVIQQPQEEIQKSETQEQTQIEAPKKLPIQERLNYEIVVSYQDLLIGKNIYVKPPYFEQDLIEFLQYWKEMTKQYKKEKVISILLFNDRNEAKNWGKNLIAGTADISKVLGTYASDPEYGYTLSIQRNNQTIITEEGKY